jgi:uncharacterized protein
MENVILKFASSARAAGLRVSTAEVLDCLGQLPLIDLLDEAQFATLLRSHFAKSRLERARFDDLYHLFFHELREDLSADSNEAAERAEALVREIFTSEAQTDVMPEVAEFLAGDPESYLRLLQEIQSEGDSSVNAPRGIGSNWGGLYRRLPILQALNRSELSLEQHLANNQRRIDRRTREEVQRLVTGRLESARRLLLQTGPPEVAPLERRNRSVDAHGELGQLPFANLTPGEIIRLREVIAKLARRLRDIVTLRYAARSRGALDVKRTLRAAGQTQGVPIRLRLRQKPPRRGRIVTICDVSGSVWSSARFMLNMLYALQDCFERVRSFVFIDEPIEITRFFDDHDVDRALQEVLQLPDVNYGAYTDYGRMLRRFQADYIDSINKKTTVIVIGDGRTNYGNPEQGILERLRDRSRRLLWINPESEQFWNTGDSEMATFAVFCNEVRNVQNLNQLAAFFEDLML